MANATDFIAGVYDVLANTFNMGSSPPPNLFMQMAWPGISINPDDLKDSSGRYDTALAEEIFSSLANIAPALSKSKFENSAFYVDDIYDIILSCARPNGVADSELEVNPMYKLFADAQYEFSTYTKGSISDPSAFYRPCKATPSNWYDERSASSWTNINIESKQIKPVNKHDVKSPFVRFNGMKLVEKGIMKIKSDKIINVPLKSRLVTNNINSNTLFERDIKTKSFTTTPSLDQVNTQKVFKDFKTTRAKQPTLIQNNSFKVKMASTNLKNTIKRPLPYTRFAKNATLLENVKIQDINPQKLTLNSRIFSAKDTIFINEMLIKDLPYKESVGSDGFGISFKFCRVNIDRPWMNLALLAMPGWSIYGASQGQYSTGSSDNNPGVFPMITTSFILISNVSITANWSDIDKTNLANAISFGPFDIRNSTFNQNKLEIKGMQIIGCFSKLTPILAPIAYPV